MLLSNSIAIATIPGEPFVDLQIALRDKSEVANTFLFGYTFSAGGEWIGYAPTLKAAAEGGYGAGYSTNIEVGAGEAMIDRHIVNLFTMLGRLKKSPCFCSGQYRDRLVARLQESLPNGRGTDS